MINLSCLEQRKQTCVISHDGTSDKHKEMLFILHDFQVPEFLSFLGMVTLKENPVFFYDPTCP